VGRKGTASHGGGPTTFFVDLQTPTGKCNPRLFPVAPSFLTGSWAEVFRGRGWGGDPVRWAAKAATPVFLGTDRLTISAFEGAGVVRFSKGGGGRAEKALPRAAFGAHSHPGLCKIRKTQKAFFRAEKKRFRPPSSRADMGPRAVVLRGAQGPAGGGFGKGRNGPPGKGGRKAQTKRPGRDPRLSGARSGERGFKKGPAKVTPAVKGGRQKQGGGRKRPPGPRCWTSPGKSADRFASGQAFPPQKEGKKGWTDQSMGTRKNPRHGGGGTPYFSFRFSHLGGEKGGGRGNKKSKLGGAQKPSASLMKI